MALRITQSLVDDVKAAYPPEVREPTQYLYGYMTAHCNGDRNRLAAKLSQLGFSYQANYFYKLFTGRWLENGEFKASSEKIIAMASALQDALLGRMRDGRFPPVETEVFRLIRDSIDAIRQPGRICKWLFLTARSGGQKSYCLDWYRHEVNSGRTLYLESPATPDLASLIFELAKALGKDTMRTRYDRISYISEQLNEDHALIIDNAQRLFNENKRNRQDCFSFLQRVQDQTKCAVVLVFVTEVIDLPNGKRGQVTNDTLHDILTGSARGFFTQFLGRIGGAEHILRLPEVTSDHDLRAFARAAGFDRADDITLILPILRELDRRAGGIRNFLQQLQLASQRAQAEKRPTRAYDLLDHLPTDALTDKQRDKILALQAKAQEAA